jgi:hypothetical protein
MVRRPGFDFTAWLDDLSRLRDAATQWSGPAVWPSENFSVLGNGVAHAAGIDPLGTKAADLAALDEAIAAYDPLATAPRKAIIDGKQVTTRIETNTKEADALLRDELDKSMRKFKRKAPDFAKAYADARIIVELGSAPAPKPAPPKPEGATTLTTGGLQPA